MALKTELGARLGDDSKTSRPPVAKNQRSSAFVKELTDAFRFFDLNGDGKLSVQEVATVVRSLSDAGAVAEGDLVKLIRGVDADGDGCLDLHEFIDLNTRAIAGMGRAGGAEVRESENDAVVAAFDKFDGDGDGFLSAEELHNVLGRFDGQTYSLEECRGMIAGGDENGDQVMSLQEFQDLVKDESKLPQEKL